MNEAEQPPAILSDDKRTWSSQACDGVKPYFAPTVFDGKLSNVHMPSSARIDCVSPRNSVMTAAIKLTHRNRFLMFIRSS